MAEKRFWWLIIIIHEPVRSKLLLLLKKQKPIVPVLGIQVLYYRILQSFGFLIHTRKKLHKY